MVSAFGLTNIGCVRANNEDFYALIADANLYILADGMGGCQAGEVAAQMAVETVVAYFRQDAARDASALSNAYELAHQQVQAAASSDERLGCTLVAALITEPAIFIASVGDSRAYVFADGACQYITSDQTWMNEVGRELGMSEAEFDETPEPARFDCGSWLPCAFSRELLYLAAQGRYARAVMH
jgi:protein phosphatase